MTKLTTRKDKLLAEVEEQKLFAEDEECKLFGELKEEEALAQLRLEGAHLEAEEKALECSSCLDFKLGGGIKSRLSLRLSIVKKSCLHIKNDTFKRSGEMDSVKLGYNRSKDLKSISKNGIAVMTCSNVSGSALRDACGINRFQTKPQVLASAPIVKTADNLERKIKENFNQVGSSALMWRQTAKSADFGTQQEKERGSFPLQLLARPEQNES